MKKLDFVGFANKAFTVMDLAEEIIKEALLIKFKEYILLKYISEKEGADLDIYADKLKVSRMILRRHMDALERHGMIKRLKDIPHHDRRQVFVKMTDMGWYALKKGEKALNEKLSVAMSEIRGVIPMTHDKIEEKEDVSNET